MTLRRVAVAAVVVLALGGCATSPPPPSASPSPAETGFVEVALEIAPGSEQFFASQHRGRILAADGSVLADWEITAGAAPVSVPTGAHQLQAFTVFLSDFIQCSADPAAPGKERCEQPTLGPSQVCATPIEVMARETLEARFRSLPEGRCELLAGAAPAVPPLASPGDSSPTPAAARVCAGTGWPPFHPEVILGLSATATDRSHLTIANATDRDRWYRLSGWETMTLEDCQGLVEVEIERGPIAARASIETTFGFLDGRLDVPVTLGWWDAACGEACARPALSGMDVERSAREPASS